VIRQLGAALASVVLGASVAAAPGFTLSSTTFRDGASLPASAIYDKGPCSGANRSPQLAWSGAPKATRSFALVVHDPDAPAPGGWYHWIVYNIPPATRRFESAANVPKNELGNTSYGETGYGGPCPPPGKPHHYRFTLYALNVARLPGAALTGPQLEARIRGHVLAQTRLTGLYRR
jgi:hypothetical protein